MSTQITSYYERISQLPEDASVTFRDVSWDEYEELLEDLYDLAVIEQRKNEPTILLAEVERRLNQRVAREKLK